MRAVIYCRVSTKQHVQNLSLSTQLAACQAYCRREGIEVVEVFEDAGESAKTTDRPAFQRVLSYCRTNKGRVQFVVVYNVTRFSRNAYDHAVVRALLRRLREQIALATIELEDARVDQIDVEACSASRSTCSRTRPVCGWRRPQSNGPDFSERFSRKACISATDELEPP
jgi:DNA invertase Pin-like site-specific DNA recombinase